MTQHEHKPAPPRYQAASLTEPPEQYHGDLRKAAYLRRRAAYQLQAGAPEPVQAGDPTTGRDRDPAPRRR